MLFRIFTAAALSVVLAGVALGGGPSETEFVYQGHIAQAGRPVNGLCDFEFALFGEENPGFPQLAANLLTEVEVTNGQFTAPLDFGVDVLDGPVRFLEVRVQCPARTGVNLPNRMTISPRVRISPAPFALQTRGIFVDGSKRIGIRTQQPEARLQINTVGEDALRLERNVSDFADTQASLTIGGDLDNPGLRVRVSDDDGATFEDGIFIEETTNVGIGTTTPTTKLHVAGALRADLGVSMPNPNNPSASMGFGWLDDVPRLRLGGSGVGNRAGFHIQGIGDKSLLRILDSGSVGVGTEAPEAKLHVKDGDAGVTPNSNSRLIVERSDSTFINILTPETDQSGVLFGNPEDGSAAGGVVYNSSNSRGGMQFRVSGNSAKMTIVANGDVGIGTTAPTARLHVNGPSGDDGVKLPDSSVGPAETFAEPGLAQRFQNDDFGVGFQLPPNESVVLSARTIEAPSDGYILALGSFGVQEAENNLFAADTGVSMCITQATDSFDCGRRPSVTVAPTQPAIASSHAVFPVSAGPQNVFIWARSSNPSDEYEALDISLTLVFIPTAYGTVDGTE